MRYNNKILVVLASFIILPVGGVTSCGGGSSSGDATASSTYGISGTVTEPGTSGAGLSSLLIADRPARLVETGASGTTCSIYNVSSPPTAGEAIGTLTTATDGTWSTTVPQGDVNAGDQLIVECANGISGQLEMPATLDADAAMALGTTDLGTTLAVQQLIDTYGSTPAWGAFDIDNTEADFDLECYLDLAEAQWSNAATDGDAAIETSMGTLETFLAGAWLTYSGGTTGDYASMTEMIQAGLDGSLPADFVTSAAANAATYFGGAAATYESNWESAQSNYETIQGILVDYYAGGQGVGEPAALKNVVTTAAADSFCYQAKADENFLNTAMDVMMQSDSAAELLTTWGNTGAVGLLDDLLDDYCDADGVCTYTGDTINWNSDGVAGMFRALSGDYSTVTTGMIGTLLDNAPTGTDGAFRFDNWGLGLMSTYISYYEDNSAAPSSDLLQDYSGWVAYSTQSGTIFNPVPSYDWTGAADTAIAAAAGEGGFRDCLSSPEGCISDLPAGYVPGDFDQSTATGCDNDGICEAGEDVYSCAFDCAVPPDTGEDIGMLNDISGSYLFDVIYDGVCRSLLGGGTGVLLVSQNTNHTVYSFVVGGESIGTFTIDEVSNGFTTYYYGSFAGVDPIGDSDYTWVFSMGDFADPIIPIQLNVRMDDAGACGLELMLYLQ